jgi:hypothetical protein
MNTPPDDGANQTESRNSDVTKPIFSEPMRERLAGCDMSARLRSDFWVAAYLRRCGVEGVDAVLRRRGAAEAGSILVKIDRLDGTSALFGPAPQSEVEHDARLFARMHSAEWIEAGAAESRLTREISFDSDLWVVEVEDRLGRNFLDLAA